MKIIGYSERGMVNSMFYEMKYSPKGFELIKEFLSKINFPNPDNSIEPDKDDVQIYIESSLSDFGDADVIIIVPEKITIFIEAKVKTRQRKDWNIEKEFEKIINIEGKQSSSNLFIQLYHKVRIFNELRKENGIENLKKGIKFGNNSSKKQKKIGNNPIVQDIVTEISKTKEAYFVALVPDSEDNLIKFYGGIEENFKNVSVLKDITKKDLQNWGYITWKEIEKFCKEKENELRETLDNFHHNEGQIY